MLFLTRRREDAKTGGAGLRSFPLRVFASSRALFSSLLAALLLPLAMGGCERKITNANLGTVKPDMTAKEVESILGVPTRIEHLPEQETQVLKTVPITRYIYEQDGQKVELLFVGDRLGTAPVNGTATTAGAPAVTGSFSP